MGRLLALPTNNRLGRRGLPRKNNLAYSGSSKANGREPRSCLGRVFNLKLGCFTKCKQSFAYTKMAESRLESSAQVLSC